jgi:hypothetical protein
VLSLLLDPPRSSAETRCRRSTLAFCSSGIPAILEKLESPGRGVEAPDSPRELAGRTSGESEPLRDRGSASDDDG